MENLLNKCMSANCMHLTNGFNEVAVPANLYISHFHTALKESFSLSISTLTKIQPNGPISFIDGKILAIMLHLCSINQPHRWGSGIVVVVAGEHKSLPKTFGNFLTLHQGVTYRMQQVRYIYIYISKESI